MVRERDRRKAIWPTYYDIRLSRAEGRRLPKRFCLENPDIDSISGALKALKMDFEIEEDKAFPSCWWKREGRALVNTDLPKTKLLLEIGRKLKS